MVVIGDGVVARIVDVPVAAAEGVAGAHGGGSLSGLDAGIAAVVVNAEVDGVAGVGVAGVGQPRGDGGCPAVGADDGVLSDGEVGVVES